MAEAKKEAEGDFSLISKVRNRYVIRTILALRSFPKSEQKKIIAILIKKYYRTKLDQLGETITDEERVILEKIDQLEKSPEIKQIAEVQESSFIPISKTELRTYVAKAIYEQLEVSSDYYDDSIGFNTPMGNNWSVRTYVDYCPYSYRYCQQVWYVDNQREIKARISSPVINVPR